MGLALGYEDLNDHDQLRLYFSAVAYRLLQAWRRLGLPGTEMARAQCQTMRRIPQGGTRSARKIRSTVRKVWVSLAGSYPYARLFAPVYANLPRAPAMRCGGQPETDVATLPLAVAGYTPEGRGAVGKAGRKRA